MSLKNTIVFILLGLSFSCSNLYADDLLIIEKEFNELENTYLTVAKIDNNSITALTKVPALGGDEIMQIKFKPGGRDETLFTMYYYRNGQLEGYHEYDWRAPKNSFEFKKSSERRIDFRDIKNRENEIGILDESKLLYLAIKNKQNGKN